MAGAHVQDDMRYLAVGELVVPGMKSRRRVQILTKCNNCHKLLYCLSSRREAAELAAQRGGTWFQCGRIFHVEGMFSPRVRAA